MEIILKKDETIKLYLNKFISINEICNYIIKLKNDIEEKETLDYHLERWENIAGEHYITRDTHTGKFSYIFDNKDYIIKPDHRLNFYKITGISYQIIELIHELIKIKGENEFNTYYNSNEEYKKWLKYDDNLYTLLADKISIKMRNY